MKTKGKIFLLVLLALSLAAAACAQAVTADDILGTVDGNIYENRMIGLGCTFDAGSWHYQSEDEIAATNKLAKAMMNDDLLKMVETAQNVTVMAVQSGTGIENVNVQIQNVKDYVSVYESVGLKYVANLTIDQFKQALESLGYSNLTMTIGDTVIGGETFTCLDAAGILAGVQVYMKQVWMISGEYMIYITATSGLTNNTDDLISHFYLLK